MKPSKYLLSVYFVVFIFHRSTFCSHYSPRPPLFTPISTASIPSPRSFVPPSRQLCRPFSSSPSWDRILVQSRSLAPRCYPTPFHAFVSPSPRLPLAHPLTAFLSPSFVSFRPRSFLALSFCVDTITDMSPHSSPTEPASSTVVMSMYLLNAQCLHVRLRHLFPNPSK